MSRIPTIASSEYQAVGLVNLPGKQILDEYPFLQSLPEFLTPYKRTYRENRKEGFAFWMSLADEVKKRMDNGTATNRYAISFTSIRLGLTRNSFCRKILEMEDHGLTYGEFCLLTGGELSAHRN